MANSTDATASTGGNWEELGKLLPESEAQNEHGRSYMGSKEETEGERESPRACIS